MSIEDVAVCEKCGYDLSEYYTDEINFDINHEGHYKAHYLCPQCDHHTKIYFRFRYEITDYEC